MIFRTITAVIKRLSAYYVDNARLTVADKLSRLLSQAAFVVIATFLAIIALTFISIGVADLLRTVMAPIWAFTIVGGCYLLIIAVLLILKRPLFVNPIERFIIRLMAGNPETIQENVVIPQPNESDANDVVSDTAAKILVALCKQLGNKR